MRIKISATWYRIKDNYDNNDNNNSNNNNNNNK